MKRIIFTIIFGIFCISTSLYLYMFLQPDSMATLNSRILDKTELVINSESSNSNNVVADLNDKINELLEVGDNFFYFYNSNDNTSSYVELNIMKPLARSIKLEEFTNLNKIDIVSVTTDNYLLNKFSEQYQIEEYPAFIVINKDENNQITYHDLLCYDSENPFNDDDIKNWMLTTNSWLGEKEEVKIPIAEAIE